MSKRHVFDVDGVILDFNKHFVEYHNLKTPNDPMEYNVDEWNWGRTGVKLEELRVEIAEFIASNPVLTLMCAGWAELTSKLRKAGHKVIIVTVYPNRENRRKNLEMYSIEYDEIVFVDQHDEKAAIIMEQNPDVVVEDCPHHLERLIVKKEEQRKPLLFAPKMWKYVHTKFAQSRYIHLYEDLDELHLLLLQ